MDICTVQCPTAIWKSLDGYNTKNIIWISSQWTLQCIGEARIGGELWIVLCLNYADNFPSEQCILVLILWSFCCKPKIQERVRGASLGDCSYLLLYFHQLGGGERSSRQLVSQPTLGEAKESWAAASCQAPPSPSTWDNSTWIQVIPKQWSFSIGTDF